MLRFVLDGNVDREQPLGEQFKLFLELLVDGNYRLSLGSEFDLKQAFPFPSNWNPAIDFDHFYPIDTQLVLTQSPDSLNSDRVAHFAELIESGKRPIILAVTTNEAWCDYVIDGHHKFAAYKQLNTQPMVFTATRVEPPTLPNDTFSTYFDNAHPLAKHYERVKNRYGG